MNSSPSQVPPTSTQDTTAGAQCVLVLPTMTCGACIRHVKTALQGLPGVARVDARLDTHQVTVTHDANQVGTQDIQAALAKAGYRAAL